MSVWRGSGDQHERLEEHAAANLQIYYAVAAVIVFEDDLHVVLSVADGVSHQRDVTRRAAERDRSQACVIRPRLETPEGGQKP
jgi:hypothetical protein